MAPIQESFRERPDVEMGLTTRESVELFQDAYDKAVDEAHEKLQQSSTGGDMSSKNMKMKLTLDLKNRHLNQIPKEVIAIIEQDVERLQLAHNQLCHIAIEFASCSALRYLNLRDNIFKEVPKVIFDMPQLEILDLGRNKLSEISDDIERMRALRVFSVEYNNIADLPLCLGNISTLRMLKLFGNPLNPGLKRIVGGNDTVLSPPPPFVNNDNERDKVSTKKVIDFLRAQAASKDSGEDSSDGPLETPRASSRFPVQPRTYGHSTSESESASGLRSPGFAKSPVLIRSHYWLPSSQNNILQSAAPKRPGLAPSPLGNERNRSNSESILQATQNNKNKRMGIVPKKYADHTFLEETRANKNSLHSRGHSHGSALRHTVRTSDVKPSNVVIGQMKESQGGVLVHRLSSLPEQKEAVLPVDKMFGAAKGLLYSLNLPHPQIMILEPVIKYGSLARLSLERVFPNAATHIDRLGQDLSKNTRNAIRYTEFKDEVKDIEIMAKATCASALAHQPVAKALSYGAEQLIEDADLRYVRTLMLFLYGSLNEISNSSTTLRLDQRGKIAPRSRAQQVSTTTQIANGEQRSANRDHSVTPTRERPKPERRWRNGSPVQRSNSHTSLRTARGAQTTVPLQLGRQSRSNSRATTLHSSASSSVVSTPRSGESFNSAAIAARSRRGSVDVSPEQAHTRKEQQDQFEQIFFCLTNSVDQGLRIIPTLEPFFLHNLDASQKQYPLQSFIKIWATLVARTRYCLEMSETLKIRLSTVKIVDPEARNARDFWRIVRNFVDSYYSLLATLRQARSLNLTPNEMRHQIQPIYKSTTEACSLIANSPWNHLTFETGLRTQPPSRAQTPAQSGDRTDRRHLPRGSGGPTVASSSSPYTLSVPATPLSAALGPAAQATVPATPASASLNRSFEGDVFQRADSLLNLQQTMIYRR